MGCDLEETMEGIIVKNLEKHIELVKGKNCQYEDSDDFLVWAWAGVNQTSIQQASDELNDVGYEVPSGDTILSRLSSQPHEVLEKGFDDILEALLSKAKKEKKLFNGPVILAIDFTDIEWYGEELPFIVKSKSKNGTNKFIRFATVAIVEDGKRFTLKVLPVTPLSIKENVVEELIRFAQQLVDIKVVLFDRGFYTNKVIKRVKKLKQPFIMPVKKRGKVKQKMKEAYFEGPLEYEMSKGATYTMMTVRDEEKDKFLPYATNMDKEPTSVHDLYKNRFGIETQYRVKNKFMGKTCSKQYSMRYAFFVLAVSLYNIWVLLNISIRGREGLNPGKIPINVDNLKHLFRKKIYRKAPSESKLAKRISESIDWF